jgi:hypothetical protein
MRAPYPFQGKPYRVTFDDVISNQKAPLGRILRNFPLCMHTPFQGNSLRGDVTSGSHVGHAQWYILYYYYSKKKVREPVAHSHAITTGQGCFLSGPLPVTSHQVAPPRSSRNATLSVLIYYSSRHERGSNSILLMIGTDCIGSDKSNYHAITTNPKCFKLFGFPIFWLWTYLIKLTPEMRGKH